MSLPPILYGLLPLVSTFLGGYVVYRWKRDLHPWLSLSGGILLGVAFLDLLPEALEYGEEAGLSSMMLLGCTLMAILFFYTIDEISGAHHHEHEEQEHAPKTPAMIRGGGMIVHRLLDGLAVGGGFAVNPGLGIIITTAVIMHSFSDGMSTVTVLKKAFGQDHRAVLGTLIVATLMPIVGSVIGFQLGPQTKLLALLLASFAGFFIFLSLADLLPQAHAHHTKWKGFLLTLLGIGIVVLFRTLAPV